MSVLAAAVIGFLFGLAWPVPSRAQGVNVEDRPVAEVRIDGLKHTPEQLVRNQIRQEQGNPYNAHTVDQDVVRITHLGRFSQVTARVKPTKDGSAVILTYQVTEQPLLKSVRIIGAGGAITRRELRQKVLLRRGDPVDPFLVEQGRKRIVRTYKDKGYFVASVEVDHQALDKHRRLIYRIHKGPKVRIQGIEFKGNDSFQNAELRNEIRSDTYFPIFGKNDMVDRQRLELDTANLRDFYHNHGYLDARVGRRIDLAPDQQSAVIIFLIDEGTQYTVSRVRVKGAKVFPKRQVKAVMELHPGSVFSGDKLEQSAQAISDMYGKLGFLETQVSIDRLFDPDRPKVELAVSIDEGRASRVGKVSVTGNTITKSKVILRQVRGMKPGRPFDRTGVKQTRRRLNNNPLFGSANVTIQGQADDPVRDVVVEVDERSTGKLTIGAGVSSDAGLIGAINVIQPNFDITATPDSLDELLSRDAFRGAGQTFSLRLSPGTETSTYSVGFREPYLFSSDYFLDTNLRYFTRDRDKYAEERAGGTIGVGRRLGDVWSAQVSLRGDNVQVDDIDNDAPVDVFEVEGANLITGLSFSLTRSTVDNRIVPTRGSRINLGVERVGLLAGDFDFTKLNASYNKFWTLQEDFLGRKTVLSFNTSAGYIVEQNQAPIFERYYAGGQRNFRGFNYRGVGPRGIAANTGTIGDDPIGGDFRLLTGLQYEFPLVADTIRGVFFTDQGTVNDDISLDNWRISVGGGFRFNLPIFGQRPFALDFAVPLLKEDGDEQRLVSFNLSVPLQ